MLFAPPKVKSLSRYAEYGAYLGNRHFLLMLAIAITMHMAVIAVYSMVPAQEIIKIPVRVLNIKFASGGAKNGGSVQIPLPAPAPEAKPPSDLHVDAHEATADVEEEMEPTREDNVESAVDKQLTKNHAKPIIRPQAHTPPAKWERTRHAEGKVKTDEKAKPDEYVPAPESTFATPKKYVREAGAADGRTAGKAHGKPGNGNGGEVTGEAGGTEVIKRYTQTLSQWVQNHEIYARAACGEAVAAGAQCNAKGVVKVRMRIDREGRIGSLSVDQTSGQELVDQAAIAMVHASDPVPSVPSNVTESQLEFVIPVEVDLSKH